jgi:LysR family hydrogen peroxide-inducible transcriptional activator
MAFPYETEGFESVMLFEDAYRFACAADSPLARAKQVKMETLGGEPLLLLERDHCLHSHDLPLLEAAPNVVPTTFSATSLPTLVAMVAEGMGATLLPDLAINAGLAEQSHLAIRPIAGALNYRTIGLCWRRQTGRAETFRKIGEALKTWAAKEVRPWKSQGRQA